ncbi:MAG: hypothetical protein RLO12_21715 [Fulvivirga sp.]
MSEFYNQFFCKEDERYSLIIEDDGRVCYGYLLYKEQIVGDLWLYNQASTPEITDWSNRNQMPFLNSNEFVLNNILPIVESSAVSLNWELFDEKLLNVKICVDGNEIGVLKPGARPGWSKLVKKDGPLAKKA